MPASPISRHTIPSTLNMGPFLQSSPLATCLAHALMPQPASLTSPHLTSPHLSSLLFVVEFSLTREHRDCCFLLLHGPVETLAAHWRSIYKWSWGLP